MRTAAARFVLDLATSVELIDAAHELLDDGIYTYSLGELATAREPRFSNLVPWFVNALKELELPMPTVDEAVDRLLLLHATAIAEGAVTPMIGATELHSLDASLWDSKRNKVSPELMQDLRAIGDIVYRYEEMSGYQAYLGRSTVPPDDDPELLRLSDEFLRLAKVWCRRRWARNVQRDWRTSSVVALARSIDSDKAFDALPILADALQEAGCDDVDILEHCRSRSAHVRTCCVADVILRGSY